MAPNSVNPVQNNGAAVELPTLTDTISREPPPPYSIEAPNSNYPIVNQPVIHQTIIVQAPLQDRPALYNCNTCRERVLTRVEYVNTRKTHMLAGFICGLTCWCMLCCLGALPYAIPTFKKSKHYCPHCDTLLGDYTKL